MENIPASINSLPFYTPIIPKSFTRNSSRLPLPRPRSTKYSLQLNGDRNDTILIQSTIRKALVTQNHSLVQQERDKHLIIIQSTLRRFITRNRNTTNTPRKMTYAGSLFATPSKATRILNTPNGDASPIVYLHGKRLFTPNTMSRTENLAKFDMIPCDTPSLSNSNPFIRSDVLMSSPIRTKHSMNTPMRMSTSNENAADDMCRFTINKISSHSTQTINQRKNEMEQQSLQSSDTHLTMQELLNQVTQRNTTANSRYTHCVPKLIRVEKLGDSPDNTCDDFFVGKKSRWDGCSDGTCVNIKEIILDSECHGLIEKSKVRFNRKVQVIGHDSTCKYAQNTSYSSNPHRKKCLKHPSKRSTEGTTIQPHNKETVHIQKIIYMGNEDVKSLAKTPPAVDNRTRRVFGGSKPQRCKQ